MSRLEEIKALERKIDRTFLDGNHEEAMDMLYKFYAFYNVDYLIKQAERSEELEKENRIYKLRKENAQELNEVVLKPLIKQIQRYKQALEFYADRENYKTDVVSQWEPVIPVMKDNGKKARQNLKEES